MAWHLIGVAELLDKLVALRMKIAVLSNKDHSFTDAIVKSYSLVGTLI